MQPESKKQQQLATLIQEELNLIFTLLNLNMVGGQMVSITSIKMTPDLLEARIYLSIYPFKNELEMMEKIKTNQWSIKKHLVVKIKNQVRRIPTLHFFIDDSLEHMYKMENLFQQIKPV